MGWHVKDKLPQRSKLGAGPVVELGSGDGQEMGSAVEWVREKLGFVPDAVQRRVLATGTKRGLLNCTRQWGKSTVTAAKAVHHAANEAGSLTLVVSPSARQSAEFLRKAEGFARTAGFKVKGDGDNEISMELPNGSRIVGLPGSEATVRGFSAVSLLLVDEASRVTDDLYMAIRPVMAVSNGTTWLMSTPHGKRGFFWETWDRGGPEWERVQVTAYDCPRISAEFLEKERNGMTERWFRQEYLCEFTDEENGIFERDVVEKAITEEVEELVFE